MQVAETWHYSTTGVTSVGITDVSRLGSTDAQRFYKISQDVCWMYCTPCLFLPQKLVFDEKDGVTASWLPATLLKVTGTASCERLEHKTTSVTLPGWQTSKPPSQGDLTTVDQDLLELRRNNTSHHSSLCTNNEKSPASSHCHFKLTVNIWTRIIIKNI